MNRLTNSKSLEEERKFHLQSPERVLDPLYMSRLSPTPEVQPSDSGDPGESRAHSSEDKLFIQLLDDLDNISGGGSQSIHRRRRAREIFSEWLFSQDVHNPQVMRLRMEQLGRRHSSDVVDAEHKKQVRQQHSCDAEPFKREQSSRRSYGGISEAGVHRRGFLRRGRPSSFHYPSDDEDDSGYHTGSTMALAPSVKKRPPSARTEKERTWAHLDLKQRIDAFNQNEQGLFMEMSPDGRTFRGSIRIHMNLTSPINISAEPTSFYDFHNHEPCNSSTSNENAPATTSFCLPRNTTKVIHISSSDSTQQVIRALLAKFNITDDPRKFVLHEKIEGPGRKSATRQMRDEEMPLPICLSWTDLGGVKCLECNRFILQESDTGESEILWKSFNLVELESFLSVLNREEAEHIDQVKTKYRKFKGEILKHLQQKQPLTGQFNEKRVPMFV